MREQLGKPIPSPVVLGQVTAEKFCEAVKAMAERQQIPVYGFLSCANPRKLQEICDSLGPERD